MTFIKRCLLVLFFQFGCLAIEHSTISSYDEDDIRLIVGHHFSSEPFKIVGDSSEEEDDSQQSSGAITFHPKSFDFKESSVGMPRLGIVRVDNRLKDETVKLISISGNTVHFHSSFFADKVIFPGGNTTFEIVFLSRSEGHVESNLYIHSSKGLFKYHVQGFGLPNPYRLKPLIGALIPVNGSYEPLITMHNPHDTRIQVVEMLSSGTDFHLKLPENDGSDSNVQDEIDGTAWAIEPFETKPLMKGSFLGKSEGNHSGFIKIRVNSTRSASEYLVVPVEVQVSSVPGIYSPQEALDFGLMVKTDKPKTLSLSLINAQPTPVNIQSVTVKGGLNSAIRIEFRPLIIEPDSTAFVALVTYDASEAKTSKVTAGFIEIKSECGRFINVPFRANVIQGELEYNISSLGFFIKSDDITLLRNFSVRNSFTASVAIYQVNTSHPELVQIENFNQSAVISPSEQKTIFSIRLSKKSELCDSSVKVLLDIKSNITNLKLPITCYDGKLKLHTLEKDEVNFGRLELYSSRVEYFSVENSNPIEIRLKSWGSNSTWVHVELVGMQKGKKEDLAIINDFNSLKKSLFLQPGQVAVFSIELKKPSNEGFFYGESYVTTDHNQTLRVPFRFSVSKGSVYSDKILFEKSFPGKISSEKLHLTSTFNRTIILQNVRSNHHMSIWFSPPIGNENPEIHPHRKNYIGKIQFDPKTFCQSDSDCYTGFSIESQMGRKWSKAAIIDWETAKIDWEILTTLQKRFELIKELTVSNISLWIDTNENSDFKISTQITYTWPRIAASKFIVFPLTGLGNESVIDIPLTNPSSSPLVIQVLLAKDYGPLWTHSGELGNLTMGNLVFSLEGALPASSQANVSANVNVQRQIVEEVLEMKDLEGLLFFIPPGAKYFLRAKFKPITKDMASTLILLRNNLTGIETIWVKGRAGKGQMTVGNGASGSSLLFQITEKLLNGCQKEGTSKYVPPQLTVRRSFIARNVGEIPLDIQVLEIYPPQSYFWSTFTFEESSSCEGYGYRILNCHPFSLLPNHTHSIDIAFTPDFTVSRVVRSLKLTDASGLQFNYSLVAMVPSGMLSLCSSIISRPSWEPIMKYFLIAGVVISILASILMAYIEAGSVVVSSAIVTTLRVVSNTDNHRTMTDATRNDLKELATTSKLDLKSVFEKVDNRFKRNQSSIGASSLNKSICPSNLSSNINNNNINNQQFNNQRQNNSLSECREGSNSNINLRNRKKNKSSTSTSSDLIHNKLTSIESSLTSTNNTNNKNHKSSLSQLEAALCKSSSSEDSNSFTANNLKCLSKEKDDNRKQKKKNKNIGNVNNKNQKNQNKKAQVQEEETSSTTTESSNPDDFCLMAPTEKERQPSGKSVGSVSSNENISIQDSRERRNSKENKSKNLLVNSFENSGTKDDFDLVVSGKKKSNSKKKTSEFVIFNGSNNGRGSTSPKSDNLWDTPNNNKSVNKDLSEISAQTEAFLLARPLSAKRGSNDSTTNANPPNPLFPNNGLSSNVSTRLIKRPGIIGQPRVSQPQHKSYFGFRPDTSKVDDTLLSMTSVALTLAAMTSPVNTKNSRSQSSPGNTNNSWDILPDNGCDIWNRRNQNNETLASLNFPPPSSSGSSSLRCSGGENANVLGTVVTSHSHSRLHHSPTFPTSSFVQNGFTNSNNSYLTNSSMSNTIPPSTKQHNLSGTDSHSHMENSLFNAGLTNELLSNLWQLNNSSYDQHYLGRNTDPSTFSQAQSLHHVQQPSSAAAQQHSSLSSTVQKQQQSQASSQHGFLHRMRSEPSSASARRQRGHSGSNNWSGLDYSLDQRHALSSLAAENNSWTNAGGTLNSSAENAFGEWPCLGSRSSNTIGSHNTQIRPPSTPSENTDIWSNSLNTGYSESTVGTSPRLTTTSPRVSTAGNISSNEIGYRRTDVAQSQQREVEAGLGFNPFTSDIWNQTSENPSWTNAYRYSNNNE